MMATNGIPATVPLLAIVLFCAGCPATDDFVPPPPIFGFGDEEATLSPVGDTLVALVYLTRGPLEPTTLELDFEGTAVEGEDYRVLNGPTLSVQAGQSEVEVLVVAGDEVDGGRLERTAYLRLRRHPTLELSERDSLEITFALDNTVNLEIWAPDSPFPQLWGYTSFGPEPVPAGAGLSAGKHFCFAYASTTVPNTIGLYSDIRPGASTNALNMHRIYADEQVSSSSAGIRIENFITFYPDAEDSPSGRVEVIPQRVTINRTSSSGRPPFTVGLSGEGTYDELSGIILLNVYFDETEIGGPPDTLRRYSLESDERP